jgi:hypothetical protein
MGPSFNNKAAQEGFWDLSIFHEYLGPIQFTADFAPANYHKSNRRELEKEGVFNEMA